MATDPFSIIANSGTGGGAGLPNPDFGGAANLPAVATPSLPVPVAPPPTAGLSLFGGEQPAPPTPAIDKLRPGSELHSKVLSKLDAMLKFSRGKMQAHYHRWNYNEQKIQAYTGLEDYKRIMEGVRDAPLGTRPPEPVSVIVPYSYATIHAAATFVATVLHGRKPIFPLLAVRGTQTDKARYMEQALQSQIDASRGFETLWQGLWDGFIYGFGPKRITWEERKGAVIRMEGGQRVTTTDTKFVGNVLTAIDPYRFYPDPRVPISQCNIKGDFCFAESDVSETVLRDMEKDGSLRWVKDALGKKADRAAQGSQESQRRIRIGPGMEVTELSPSNVTGFRSMMEGTVRLIPNEWGLGDGDTSELWKFSWFERGQIVQAEPLNMVHGQHPFTAAEPTSFGHDFMSLSMADMIGNFQDILSWLVSSRMENVRSAVQNSFVVDPARIDTNDIRSSTIGRMIRLKQTAMGLPIQQAIMQLQINDVTQGHIGDVQNMRILADTITGVNDNMRGIQNPGGRRSATEARISMQAGGSRLSQHAIRTSAQDYHPMTLQMINNNQQFMPDQMWIEVSGDEGMVSQQLTPDMLIGDFNYQVSDGTLPFDKQAMVEQWKEITFGIAQDPELRANWDLNKIFRYTAELGGAKNIDSFKKAPPPMTGAMMDPGADPNMQALGPAMPTAPLLGAGFQG